DHLRRAVEEVLVDAQRGEEPLAEFAFQPLRERGENADAFRVEADADARVVMPANVTLVGMDRLGSRLPRDLSLAGLVLRSVGLAVGFPRHQCRLAPVGLEPGRVLREMLLRHLFEALAPGT